MTIRRDQDHSVTNLTKLEENAAGNREFVEQMILTFVKDAPVTFKSMELAYKNENWKEVRALAHKLKPNLTLMGIECLSGAIKRVELYAEEQVRLDTLSELLAFISETLDRAITELDDYLSR